MSEAPGIPLEKFVADVMSGHTSRGGLCSYCACEWPCDAYKLAEHIDDHFLQHDDD